MTTGKKAKTLLDFRANHDRDYRVRKAVEVALAGMLKDGPETWEYDADFRTRSGLGASDLAEVREGFRNYIVCVPGGTRSRTTSAYRVVWCCSPALAAKMLKFTGVHRYGEDA